MEGLKDMVLNEKGKYQNNYFSMTPFQRVEIHRKRSEMPYVKLLMFPLGKEMVFSGEEEVMVNFPILLKLLA